MTQPRNLTGAIREIGFHDTMPTMKLAVDGKTLTIVLAPATRMEFRDLTDDMLKPGTTVSIVAYQSRTRADELRAESITVGRRTTDLR
jgi:hypothetical protein